MPRLRWVFVLTVTGLCFAVMLTAYGFELARIARLSYLVDQRMDEIVRLSRRMQTLGRRSPTTRPRKEWLGWPGSNLI